jgi:hypothetical protein
MQQERSLDANAMRGDTPHGKVGVDPFAPEAHESALEHLDALSGPFYDPGVHADRVSRPKARDVGIRLCVFDRL